MKEEVICIVCPRGCHLQVDPDNDYAVTGNFCPRGIPYGKMELKDPQRVLTSTVKVKGKTLQRCPVKTDGTIPKRDMRKLMQLVNHVELTAPVKTGDIIIAHVLGTEANLVATRDIRE